MERLSVDTFVIASIMTGAVLSGRQFYRLFLKRVRNINTLPARYLSKASDSTLLGKCTHVGDGDNFRFFHTPGGRLAGWDWLRKVPTDRTSLSKETLHVRIAGVDAPECAHFGNPAQPHGKESLDWLRSYLFGKRVRIQPHSRDRFDRVVATVFMRRWPFPVVQKSVGLEMVKQGMADVFDQGGAEYGGSANEKMLRRCLKKAQAQRVGMWAGKTRRRLGANSLLGNLFNRVRPTKSTRVETPSEFKRRMRQNEK